MEQCYIFAWPLRIFSSAGIFGGKYYAGVRKTSQTREKCNQYLGAIHQPLVADTRGGTTSRPGRGKVELDNDVGIVPTGCRGIY